MGLLPDPVQLCGREQSGRHRGAGIRRGQGAGRHRDGAAAGRQAGAAARRGAPGVAGRENAGGMGAGFHLGSARGQPAAQRHGKRAAGAGQPRLRLPQREGNADRGRAGAVRGSQGSLRHHGQGALHQMRLLYALPLRGGYSRGVRRLQPVRLFAGGGGSAVRGPRGKGGAVPGLPEM